MGAFGDGKSKRPTSKNAAREATAPEQRRNRNRTRGTADGVDWSSADASRVLRAINNVTACGFAIQFGYTRDKGAYTIRIVGDGDPYTEYVRPTEDIDTYLDALAEDYEPHGFTSVE